MCLICDGMSPHEYHQRVDDHIASHGWSVVLVDDDLHEPWAYTIGLAEKGLPELVIMGLEQSASLHVVNDVAGRLVVAGAALERELAVDGIPVRMVDVHPSQWESSRFGMWQTHYQGKGRPEGTSGARQVLWPDRHGRFPTSPGFDPSLRRRQPRLDQPWGAGVVHRDRQPGARPPQGRPRRHPGPAARRHVG